MGDASSGSDALEREADEIAAWAVRSDRPTAANGKACACGGSCEKCRGKGIGHRADEGIQLKSAAERPAPRRGVPPLVHEVLSTPGAPLDTTLRAELEPRLGFDLSRVRIHADERSRDSARMLGALAYTVGNHVAFAEYSHATTAGRELIAHELVHVAQQSQLGSSGHPQIQRKPSTTRDPHAHEATVSLKWPDNPGDFWDALSAAVARSRGFRRVPADSIRNALYALAFNYYRSRETTTRVGSRVRLTVTADYDPDSSSSITGLSGLNLREAESDKPASPAPQKPAQVPAGQPAPATAVPGSRFASSPVYRMVGRMLQSSYAQNWTGAHLTLSYDGSTISAPNYEVRGEKRPDGSVNRLPDLSELARTLDDEFTRLTSFGPAIAEIDFAFTPGHILVQKYQQKRKELPDAPPRAVRKANLEPLTLDDCDPTDTNYGRCLQKLQRGNTRRALDAAHDVAKAFLDPMPDLTQDNALSLVPAVHLFSEYRKLKRVINAVDEIKDVRAVGTVEREIDALGTLDEASKALLRDKPALRKSLLENPLAVKVLELCHSPCKLPEYATPGQVERLNTILEDASKAGMRLDSEKLTEFLHHQPDSASLGEAIDALAETEAALVENRVRADADAVVDAAEALSEHGIRDAKPTDVRLQEARFGNQFDLLHGEKYPANQVPIRDRGNRLRRLDSYDPVAGEIISRKSLVTTEGQIALADEATMIEYFQEFALKYPDGAVVADVKSTRTRMLSGAPLAGQRVQGRYILEVPVQRYRIPDRIMDEARKRNITIRDINGKTY